MSQFFASGGQNIGISASVSVLPMKIQDWFPLGLISFREMKYPQIKFEIIKCNATKYLQPTELFWLESRTFKYKSSPYF